MIFGFVIVCLLQRPECRAPPFHSSRTIRKVRVSPSKRNKTRDKIPIHKYTVFSYQPTYYHGHQVTETHLEPFQVAEVITTSCKY